MSKLDEKQTADMIKITCQRPDVRQGAIHEQFGNIYRESYRCAGEAYGDVVVRLFRLKQPDLFEK